MKLSSLHLEAFYCLAQTHHFTRAAERLGLSQSALSQRIGNLEAELQTAVFIRDRAGVRLTETGRDLLRYCQVQDGLQSEFLAKLKKKNSTELAGQLRVGSYSTLMNSIVLPALTELLRKNEAVRFSAVTREIYDLPGYSKAVRWTLFFYRGSGYAKKWFRSPSAMKKMFWWNLRTTRVPTFTLITTKKTKPPRVFSKQLKIRGAKNVFFRRYPRHHRGRGKWDGSGGGALPLGAKKSETEND